MFECPRTCRMRIGMLLLAVAMAAHTDGANAAEAPPGGPLPAN